LRESDHLEELNVDRRITLKWIFKLLDWTLEWIHMAQDRNRWRALVNTVMNFRIAQNERNFLSN